MKKERYEIFTFTSHPLFYSFLYFPSQDQYDNMTTSDDEGILNLNPSSGSDKSYREELEVIEEELNNYRRALRGAEKDTFDKLINHAKIHQTAGEEQDHYKAMETFFLSIILEQQIEIMRLKRKLNGQIEVDEEY